jgi:superfamily II DNA or RNA helicase
MKTDLEIIPGHKIDDFGLDKIIALCGWDIVIVDECHKIKNPDAQRSKNIVDAFVDVPRKIMLSGTIQANTVVDIHFPYVFLLGGVPFHGVLTQRDGTKLSPSELHSTFERLHFESRNGKRMPKAGTVAFIREVLESTSVRFEKKDCLSLPDKIYETVVVEMSPRQAKLYQALQAALKADLEKLIQQQGRVSVMHVFALNAKLMEAANGWIYDDNGTPVMLPENPKLDALIEKLEEIGLENNGDYNKKVIVWSIFKQDMQMLAKEICNKIFAGDRSRVAVIDGTKSQWERREKTIEFNDLNNPLQVVVCNVLAAGTGIDLIGASYELYFSNSFRKVERSQSEDRAHRTGGQEKLTVIDFVVKDTINETVIAALKSWKSMSAALTQNLGFDPSIVSDAENEEKPAIVEGNYIPPRHIQQQGYECVLATVATAARKEYTEVQESAFSHGGKRHWTNTIEENRWLFTEYFGADIANDVINRNVRGGLAGRLDFTEAKIPIKGKGFAHCVTNNASQAHIVYFENGWIYDPSMNGKMECGKWIAIMGSNGWKIGSTTMLV